MTIKELQEIAHDIAVEKGFWSDDVYELGAPGIVSARRPIERNDGELLMLVVSELGECIEGLRQGNPASDKIPEFSNAEEELADAIIRICDMAESKGWDLERTIMAKLEYNKNRPTRHGKKF